MSDQTSQQILNITARIVTAHLGNNQVDASAIPSLIQSVYRTISSVDTPEPVAGTALQPAVPVKKSVFPDFIVCLEDGKKLKTLKRHLQISYGLTPDAYRMKWGLPRSYPMVAPNYASTRSALAKQITLGKRAPADTVEPESAEPEAAKVTVMKARRARGSKG